MKIPKPNHQTSKTNLLKIRISFEFDLGAH